MDTLGTYLPFLIPLAVIQLGLLVAAWIHILRHNTYRVGNRMLWLLVALISIIGPVLYFALGRGEE